MPETTPPRITPLALVRARLTPERIDDLKPGVAAFIGREGVFKALWVCEPEHSSYAGQMAMGMPDEWLAKIPDGFWVPLCDLTVIRVEQEGLPYAED